ncbi:hypothetical protein [Mucilaginibacter sp.]
MNKRIVSVITIIIIAVLIGVVYYRYFFVFGDGTKAGAMNYFVHKGYLFKTYEGRLIQTGLRAPAQGAIQSNEFKFSVTDTKVADSLSRYSGYYLTLHYKEYNHALPWRGVSAFVVDSIIAKTPINSVQP